MKVLVTGALGQIGSHVVELLLEQDIEVYGIDNLTTGRREHLNINPLLNLSFESISNLVKMEEIFEEFKPDVVVHTSASYKDPDDWYNDTLTNCVGGSNIIQLSKKFNVKRFIYFQTALCYGLKPNEQPITLDHPRNPEGSSYAITKTTNELFLELSGLDYVTFRLANVVGPRNVAGPLPIFFSRIKNNQQCFVTKARRDFVFVMDLAKCVIKAIHGKGHGAYHFSSGKDVAILELYDEVVKSMRLNEYPQPEIKDLSEDDVESILLDPKRTFKDFGDIEFTPIEVTVQKAIDYYEEHGTLGEYTHLRLDSEKNK